MPAVARSLRAPIGELARNPAERRTDTAGMRTLTLLITGLTAVSGVGCFSMPITVAPPAAPIAASPPGMEVLTEPPEPGFTRITLDANGATARVDEVLGVTNESAQGWGARGIITVNGSSRNVKPVCVTPCQADFKPGLHVLHFSERGAAAEDDVEVQVGTHPKVVRVALGHNVQGKGASSSAVMLCAAGIGAALIGSVLWASANSEYGKGLEGPGIGLTVGGAAMTALSIPFLLSTPDKIQPSAKTEFSLPNP